MDALLLVVVHALLPRRQPQRHLGTVGDALLALEARPLVVGGGRVRRQLGERHERPRERERTAEELVLEPLQPFQIRPERHHAHIGLVPDRRTHEHLVPVGFQRRDRVERTLHATWIALGARSIDVEIEV